jgi:hypothetical protein
MDLNITGGVGLSLGGAPVLWGIAALCHQAPSAFSIHHGIDEALVWVDE